jgi:hypothetical protein
MVVCAAETALDQRVKFPFGSEFPDVTLSYRAVPSNIAAGVCHKEVGFTKVDMIRQLSKGAALIPCCLSTGGANGV